MSTRGSPERTFSGCGLGGWQPGLEAAVDEQAPHLLERHVADEVLDVDPAVAQRAALPVGLGDLRRERDHALEARWTSAIGIPRFARARRRRLLEARGVRKRYGGGQAPRRRVSRHDRGPVI